MSDPARPGPLAGVRVVELGQYGAAPLAAMILGDYGAEVVKVEPPGGDRYRSMPPVREGESLYFMGVNRNKRGVVLDLKSRAGKAALHRLLDGADVLIENFRPGVMDRLDLSIAGLLDRHPRLVACSISGYGQDGPLRDEGAYDLIVQGWSGMMAATGEAEGAPVKLVPAVPDVLAAQQAAFAVTAALRARDATGRGQHVDVALFDVALFAHTLIYLPMLFGTGEPPRRLGSAHPEFVPNRAFRAGDGGWISSGASDQGMWRAFCTALGRPELADDPLFATNRDRLANVAALDALLDAVFATRPRDEWMAALRAYSVPASPICTLAEAIDSPQARHRAMRLSQPHPTLGEVETVGLPAKLSGTPGSLRRHAPRLGEHTREVLLEAGCSEAEIVALEAEQPVRRRE
ncbi:CaiB/BaiF CoA transferase family protein [Roseomonas sp. BN140053]|uniref:CaiB/BaiF CoA transferase family protein n=1 Tax=Roseomonas sp. BN140053 TaxID=3391898 RepID=UPI0039E8EFC6